MDQWTGIVLGWGSTTVVVAERPLVAHGILD